MRLLVVDDKEGFREQLAHIFTYEGYDVATASSGEKAIGIMAGFEPDIVITDIVMANGDGFFVLEHIQEHASHCPVIIITAYGSQESAVKALRLGAYDYVIKPFDLDIILKAVKRAADYRHLQQVVAQNQSKLATQVSQISALYDTSLDLVSHLALPEMLDSLITRVMDLLGAKGVGIYLYDETRQELTVAISRNLWNDHSGHTITLGEGLAGRVVQSGRPMRVDDYPSWENSLPAYKDTSLANVLGVPLVLQGRVVGVLKVADDAQRGGFSDNDEALLMRLAPLAALAIERARMYDQTKSQLAEVKRSHYEISALQDLTAAIQSSLALPEVLNRIADGVVQGLGYRAAIVAVYDSAKDALVIQSAVIDQNIWAEGENLAGMNLIGSYLTMDNEENLAVSSARRAKMAVTHHLVDLFRPVVDKSMAELLQQMAGVKTLATVPLVADGELVGNFFAASHKESLQETDIISLQAFARQAALAIEHARLFEEERRRHRIANTLVEVSRVINSTLELDEILGLVLEGLQSILEYDSSSILLLEQDHLRVKAIRGMLAAESLNTVLPADNDSVSGLVLDARRPIVLANVQDHPGWRDAPYGLHIHGWIGAPLIARDKPLGLICVDSRQEDVYDEQDAQLVMAFAHHAALAIENARLFEQERKHRRLADTLRGISAIIGSTLDPQELQTLILEQVSWVFPYDSCGLFLWQDGRPALAAWRRFSNSSNLSEAELSETPQGLLFTLLKGQHELVLSEVPEEMQWPSVGTARVKSWIGMPLITRSEPLGFITINSYTANTYLREDGQYAMAFARQAAVAMTNARLYDESERNRGEQQYLQEIAHVFNSTLDLEQVLVLVMAKTNELLGVEAGSVALLSQNKQELVFHASVGGGADTVQGLRIPAGEGIVGWVVEHGESLLVPDVSQDSRHYARVDDQSGFETRSILCVPLIAKGKVIGAIEVLNKIDGLFDASDLRMAESLALSAAAAIENAQLFQREKQALEKLKETQNELVQAQRLAVLGQIGVTVGHEVNNPLTAILGNADWLLQVLTELEGEPQKALTAIRSNALRIRDIIKQLEDIQSDRVTEYVAGIEMIDIHNQGAQEDQTGDSD